MKMQILKQYKQNYGMITHLIINRAEMVKRDWVKPGAVVIDCGNY